MHQSYQKPGAFVHPKYKCTASLLQQSEQFVLQATRLGAVQVLTSLLASTTDEPTLDTISHTITMCSGPMACGGKVSHFHYNGITVHIREGALGDGLGVKVWAVAHVLCRELVAHPGIVAGKEVLEIGSGTGLCGIVAAKLGAHMVRLSSR
eukprot:jgi/Chrzof1/12749/Cz07g06050.t1